MKEKELYLSPECEEITVRLEGVIAGSLVAGSLVDDEYEIVKW